MNRITKVLLPVLAVFFIFKSDAKNKVASVKNDLYFIENKGQIRDQSGHPRKDIAFSMQAPGVNIFIGKGQFHYQFTESGNTAEADREDCMATDIYNKKSVPGGISVIPTKIATYRMDVALVDANINPEVIPSEQQEYYENYYLASSPVTGLKARTFKKITLKNVYPHIDWVIYIKGNKLEHEFIIGPHGDASLIKLKYEGQTSLEINEDGSLTATTPLGYIKENAPVCYVAGFENTLKVDGAFRLKDNTLSYEVEGDYKGRLVIDPSVEWGTYYGPSTSSSAAWDVACNAAGDVYMAGKSYSATGIATTGSFLDTLMETTDAFLVKFDSSGHRLWGTYYGGDTAIDITWGSAVACDRAGNVYLAGSTNCKDNIATPGSAQYVFAGGLWSGFIAKFTPAGTRIWATYLGGTAGPTFDLEIASIVCDSALHVFVSGSTDDSANVGTPGTWKPYKHAGFDTTINDFLVLYDTAGTKIWGTYYGADYFNESLNGACASDGSYVYLCGWTNDTSTNSAGGQSIGSVGSYEPRFLGGLGGGGNRAFLAKFDMTGHRVWGTYYGDTSSFDAASYSQTGDVICDKDGNIYMFGSTTCLSGIASTGSFQDTLAGAADAFLVKFNPETGFRIWGTYFGGDSDENVFLSRIACDNSDNVYITGYTNSHTGIASSGAWQTTFGGDPDDAFLAEFTPTGSEAWSTYLGGDNSDWGYACAVDGYGGIYLCGQTNSFNQIATPGGFLPTGGDASGFYFQGFLERFTNRPLAQAEIQKPDTKLSVYPIPNKGTFMLSGTLTKSSGTATVTISDVAGRVIMNDEVQVVNGVINKQFSLDKNVPPGSYILKLVSSEGAEVIKFVKY